MAFVADNTPVYVADHFGGRVIFYAAENKLWHRILCCRQPVYASRLMQFFAVLMSYGDHTSYTCQRPFQ